MFTRKTLKYMGATPSEESLRRSPTRVKQGGASAWNPSGSRSVKGDDHINFNVSVSELFGDMGYSQPLPTEDAEGEILNWNPHGEQFSVGVHMPDWAYKETNRQGYQVKRPDMGILWIARDKLEEISDFRYDPAEYPEA